MNILITGGTGLIGKQIGIELVRKGHKLIGITRSKAQALLNAPYPATWIECDLGKSVPDLQAHQIDGVIHLAGENVGEKNWSATQKEKILQSRTNGTKHLLAALEGKTLEFFVGASAIGIYEWTNDGSVRTEDHPAATHFLADVTRAWESESLKCKARTVLFRIGVVLANEGGALPKMVFPAQIFASSALGSGQQWMSWVHLHDVVQSFMYAIETPSVNGIYNLVAPHPVQQKAMAQEIAKQLNSFNGPPVPKMMLHLLLGEQASLAINSLNVSSKRWVNAGYTFRFSTLHSALENLLSTWKEGVSVKVFHQYFPLAQDRVFAFFANAQNLERITPETLNFRIVKMSTDKIQKDTLIDYKLNIHSVPVNWQTRIEAWEPNTRFIDMQLKGPYALWHHTHTFEKLSSGTLMTDVVRYKLPLGLPGRLVAQAWVNGDVERIFAHRRKTVVNLV
jgi:uncharacterized protein